MKVLVLSWCYPNHQQPLLGSFVRERTKALAERCEVKVVAPARWFPWGGFWMPKQRPVTRACETLDGIEILHPRFFSFPIVLKSLEGVFYFLSTWWTLRALRKRWAFDVIDAHFVYPDGVAGVLLGKALRVPVTITLRGMLHSLVRRPLHRMQIKYALRHAQGLMAVSQSLADHAERLGVAPGCVRVVQNGVDLERFQIRPKAQARAELGIDSQSRVLISVGHALPGKGFQRVIKLMPQLLERYPDLVYVIVGGETSYANYLPTLQRMIAALGLADHVRITGPQEPDRVVRYLNAADVFCLLTESEGWANVFLEAIASGLPVVTTRVGGNAEVISDASLGTLVDYGDTPAALNALDEALGGVWDRNRMRAHAERHTWQAVAGRAEAALAQTVNPVQSQYACVPLMHPEEASPAGK